ncbi:cytochrome c oxidase subunit II [Stenotrophobium rhamnosiphilum]|uniref:Cytochrome c oxidase subunit 2 n=2 Tax=Stenotrophobium rhamnosiphilum TaxID=2029166 RepID=A0A2T5MGW2_9GAMM|nr:cytochrome c oxidase subunit II [Stenotrophobium rhamnosiphilum]
MLSKSGLRGWLARSAALMTLWSLASEAVAFTGEKWNMTQGVTAISHEVYKLHMAAFYVCCVIGFIVFGAIIYSIINHRRSKHPKPADFHESTLVEIIWTAIPFVILIGLAIPAAGTLIKMEDTRNSELTVKVTGFQWKWQYEYLGEGVSFYSTLSQESNVARQLGSGIDVNTVPNYLVDVDNELVLPVGKKIRFVITANDVIHAWWVPALAIKKDAIPGYVNEVWTKIDVPGTYRGVCAELCGRDHGFMPIVVRAVSEAEYKTWLEGKKKGAGVEVAPAAAAPVAAPAAEAALPVAAPAAAKELSKDELVAAGEKVYTANCAACHQATGAGLPPNFPALKGDKVANGPAEGVIKQVLNGKNLMPPFKQLSDQDIAAVASYVRTSWGNKGSVVTAEAVAAARK